MEREGEECVLIITEEEWFVMQEVNQLRVMPVMPMAESLCMRTLWSSLSKAEDMSRKTRRTSMVPQLLLRPDSRSEVMRVRADSVDLWGRQALWKMLGILLVVRYVISWEEITRSRILEQTERLQMGRQLEGDREYRCGFLRIGVMTAFLKSEGRSRKKVNRK